jgi:hypothetical protein
MGDGTFGGEGGSFDGPEIIQNSKKRISFLNRLIVVLRKRPFISKLSRIIFL